jgi:hypothetical protein
MRESQFSSSTTTGIPGRGNEVDDCAGKPKAFLTAD